MPLQRTSSRPLFCRSAVNTAGSANTTEQIDVSGGTPRALLLKAQTKSPLRELQDDSWPDDSSRRRCSILCDSRPCRGRPLAFPARSRRVQRSPSGEVRILRPPTEAAMAAVGFRRLRRRHGHDEERSDGLWRLYAGYPSDRQYRAVAGRGGRLL